LRPGQSAASLYALLVGLRNQAKALLERLETRGVVVRQDRFSPFQLQARRERFDDTPRRHMSLAHHLALT
jgi:hypothetical protein